MRDMLKVAPTRPDVAGLSAKDVTVRYRNGHTALYDASFEIPCGTVTALVGVNGAGKSTLFKALMNFVPVVTGEISIMGLTVREALARNMVAYVPQAEEVDWSFPVLVEDVVMMGRYGHMGFLRRPSAADHAAVEAALGRVNMQEFRKRQIGELSGGHRKRVFLARAVCGEQAPSRLRSYEYETRPIPMPRARPTGEQGTRSPSRPARATTTSRTCRTRP